MIRSKNAQLSAIFCMIAIIIDFLERYAVPWISNNLPGTTAGLIYGGIFFLSAIPIAISIIFYLIYAQEAAQGKGFAIAAGVFFCLAFLTYLSTSYLYDLNDHVVYRIVFNSVIILFNNWTAIVLLIVQYTRACEKTIASRGFGIAVLVVYLLKTAANIVNTALGFIILESTQMPYMFITPDNILSKLSKPLFDLILILTIAACILFLRKGKSPQPAFSPLPGLADQPGVCPRCGRANGPDANFCAVCAIPLQASASPARSVQGDAPRCPSCGAPVTPDDSFCALCGEKTGLGG